MSTPKTVAAWDLDGAVTEFDIPFDYLSTSFVKVTLHGDVSKPLVLGTDYQFLTASRIKTFTQYGPPEFNFIEIRRVTSTTDRLVEFQDASILTAVDMNTADLQVIHIAEEARDSATETLGVNNLGELDARMRRLVNLKDGVLDTDAATVGQYKRDSQSAWNAANEATGLVGAAKAAVLAFASRQEAISATSVIGQYVQFEVSGRLVEVQRTATGFTPDMPAGTFVTLQGLTALKAYTGRHSTAILTSHKGSNPFTRTEDTSGPVDGIKRVVDALGRHWVREIGPVVDSSIAELIGNGTDETLKIQALLNASSGSAVQFRPGAVYGFTYINCPNDTKLVGTGYEFRRLISSTSAGFRTNERFSAEYLKVLTPGGTGGDRSIKIQGSFVDIGFVWCEADAQGAWNTVNNAIEISSNPVGTILSRIKIGGAFCRNYSSFLLVRLAVLLDVSNVIVENYRTAVYLIDVARSDFRRFRIRGLGAAVNGTAGENGLLIESTTVSASTSLTFTDWIVADSGEHAYRLGGQQRIDNVTYERCIAIRPGSSILTGNTTSGEWHGGCGFKSLGGASEGGTRHRYINYIDCAVYDSNLSFGSYPGGHGVNNFTPFLIVCSDDVNIVRPVVARSGNPDASSRISIMVGASDRVKVVDPAVYDATEACFKVYQEAPFPGFPGYLAGVKGFTVHGGTGTITASNPLTAGACFYVSDAITHDVEDIRFEGVKLRGGAVAVRMQPPGTGAYKGVYFNFDYESRADATATEPAVVGVGAASACVDISANVRPSSYGMTVATGSRHFEKNNGRYRIRRATGWADL